jgi:hypothetical protein
VRTDPKLCQAAQHTHHTLPALAEAEVIDADYAGSQAIRKIPSLILAVYPFDAAQPWDQKQWSAVSDRYPVLVPHQDAYTNHPYSQAVSRYLLVVDLVVDLEGRSKMVGGRFGVSVVAVVEIGIVDRSLLLEVVDRHILVAVRVEAHCIRIVVEVVVGRRFVVEGGTLRLRGGLRSRGGL